MNRNLFATIGGLVLIILVGVLALMYVRDSAQTEPDQATTTPSTPAATPTPTATKRTLPKSVSFTTPKKSAHFETSTPAHGTILPAPPTNIVIDFNFDLAEPSEIQIDWDVPVGWGGEPNTSSAKTNFATGATIIDSNKLSLRRAVDATAPDGLYRVSYRACWPDKSCHDGKFEFAIDRTLAAEFTDLRKQSKVAINLAQISFQPREIRISRGTTVTWTNTDPVEHYVNTDSHPAHTYHPTQNSRALSQGQEFSLTFDTPGAYPYHCSAHAASMTGMIVVE